MLQKSLSSMILNAVSGIMNFIFDSSRAFGISCCATFKVQREGRRFGEVSRTEILYAGNSIVSSQVASEYQC